LHAAPPGAYLTPEARELVAASDVILALDWLDLAGTLRQAYGDDAVAARVIHVSCDAHSHRGWSADHQGLPPVDLYLMCETDSAVPLLLEGVSARLAQTTLPASKPLPPVPDAVSLRALAAVLERVTRGIDVCYTRFPLGWNGAYTHFRHPLDYIGHDGGAGVGSGPGNTVGAALALKGSGRIPIGLLGDGDFLMGNTAVWTAARYEIPCLMIVCNNRSFYNDERHQGRIALQRGRPEENRWIGQRIGDPDVDVAGMARSLGAVGIGPVTDPAALQPAVEEGIRTVQAGRPCVIDAHVLPGYDAHV
jgi:thiamine pyrophosphate-dependent acetolactate synthase large subunit-like protein